MTDKAEDPLSLNASVEAAIEACGGDARAAVRALIVANSYLEAEVNRLAEAVSTGFTRGFRAKGKELPVSCQLESGGIKPRPNDDSRFPHSVDLVPPEEGFPEAVEDHIARFLKPLYGRYDLIVDLRSDDLIERYCFARERDAVAFHTAFASAAVRSHVKRAG